MPGLTQRTVVFVTKVLIQRGHSSERADGAAQAGRAARGDAGTVWRDADVPPGTGHFYYAC